jgi:hypothetical protein
MYNRRPGSHQLDRSGITASVQPTKPAAPAATINVLIYLKCFGAIGFNKQIFGADKQVPGRGLRD